VDAFAGAFIDTLIDVLFIVSFGSFIVA